MVRDVLRCGCRIPFGTLSDDATLVVDDQKCLNTLVLANAVDALLEVSHLITICAF